MPDARPSALLRAPLEPQEVTVVNVYTTCTFCGVSIVCAVSADVTKKQAAQTLDYWLGVHLAHHVDEWLEEVFSGPKHRGSGPVRPADPSP